MFLLFSFFLGVKKMYLMIIVSSCFDQLINAFQGVRLYVYLCRNFILMKRLKFYAVRKNIRGCDCMLGCLLKDRQRVNTTVKEGNAENWIKLLYIMSRNYLKASFTISIHCTRIFF